jgi:DNA-binding NarL/FixJ family response regulator
MTGNRNEIMAYGFDGYISKPINWQLLEEMIREQLSGN